MPPTFNLPVPETTAGPTKGELAPVQAGAIPANVITRVTISGYVNVTPNPEYAAGWPQPSPAMPQQVGPGGVPGSVSNDLRVCLNFIGPAGGSACPFITTSGESYTSVVRFNEPHTVLVGRRGIANNEVMCQTPSWETLPQCPPLLKNAWTAATYTYDLTSDQSVRYERVEGGTLSLSPRFRSFSPPGANAAFLASITPAMLEGHYVPYSNMQWRWKPDSGQAATLPACVGSLGCSQYVTSSGTFELEGDVNGQPAKVSSRVNIVPCPQNDSLLDHPVVRKALKDAWQDSNADDSNKSQRQERKIAIYRDSAGTYFPLPLYSSNDTPCMAVTPVPSSANGDTLVTVVHTHPFRPGESLPSNCLPPNTTGWYAPNVFGGPSSADWESTVVDKVPILVPDKRNVYRGEPLQQSDFEWKTIPGQPNGGRFEPKAAAWQGSVRSFGRPGNACIY